MNSRQFAAVAACMSIALGAWGPAAKASVSFDYDWSGIQCGYAATGGGPVTAGSCSSPSFSAVVQGGGYAFVTATLNYNYHDDGLALPSPVSFLANTRGSQVVTVGHEAAAIYFQTSSCVDLRTCTDLGSRERRSNNPFFIVLGDNDTPDTLSGSFTYTATVSAIPPFGGSVFPFLAVAPVALATTSGLQIITPGPTAPVPEPSTWALMALGLGAVAWARRRSAASAA